MKSYEELFDKVGITASSLCILHCIGTIFLIFIIPASTLSFFLSEKIHTSLAFTVLGIGVFSFIPGYKLHKNKIILLLAFTGIALIITPHIISENYINELIETSFTLLGGTALITAHWSNRIYCKRCKNKPLSCVSSHQACINK